MENREGKSEIRQCQSCRKSFTIEPEDFAFYGKIQVPPPTWCPSCRLQRRLFFMSFRNFYRNQCRLCRKQLLSSYSSDKPVEVYCNKCWWSDAWDPLSYGRAPDFAKPFLNQLLDLKQVTPVVALQVDEPNILRSEYCDSISYAKDCYLVFFADYVENCAYCDTINHSRDCLDCLMTYESELCYECVNVSACYAAEWSVDCEECRNITLCRDLVGCSDCFASANLRNKQYYFLNEPLGKDEYFSRVKQFSARDFRSWQEKAEKVWHSRPVKYYHGRHNTNASGDYISHSKNTRHAYQCNGAEDSKFLFKTYLAPVKDSYDYVSWGASACRVYECMGVGDNVSDIRFSYIVWSGSMDVEYSLWCLNCQHIFGCCGLRNKKYCILNKQYAKAEYEALVEKIRRHMTDMPYRANSGHEYAYGEFLPSEFSYFSYNETVAQEYFPLTVEASRKAGYAWHKTIESGYEVTVSASDFGIRTAVLGEDLVGEVFECGHKNKCGHKCSGAFRIIKQELDFYRQQNLPVPAICPNCRHGERLQYRNGVSLFDSKCGCAGKTDRSDRIVNRDEHLHGDASCPNDFQTSYPPDSSEAVYCERCYQSESL